MRQNIWTFVLFFSIATAIFESLHFYLGWRLIRPAAYRPRTKKALWILILILPVFTPLTFTSRMIFTEGLLTDFIGWVAYLELGIFSLLLSLVLLKDIILGFKKLGSRIVKIHNPVFNPERRQFVTNSVNLSLFGTALLFSGYGFYEARRQPLVEKIRIHISDLPPVFEGYKIAQFSDLHVGPTIKRPFVQSVANQVNNLGADAIVFTGDLVDGSVPGLRNDVAPLKDLSAPDGVYYITGNHEYYSGALAWIDHVTKLGFIPLIDEHKVIVKNGEPLILAGVTDYSAKSFIPEHTSDPHKAIAGAPDSKVRLLLAHQPRNIFEAASAGFHLQISGHTHGGQYIPWSFLVTLSQPFIIGLHQYKSTQIYVNRGTGYWGPPLRLGIPSEVTLFTLTGAV
jgi:predicted MPP superfamily phosphohydrolase